jgi:hypothetical protein
MTDLFSLADDVMKPACWRLAEGVMTRWIGMVVAVGIAGLALAAPSPSISATPSATKPQATDIGARRHDRRPGAWRAALPYEPRYYARPYYYRPYPYGVPAPFVFGFGPFWW